MNVTKGRRSRGQVRGSWLLTVVLVCALLILVWVIGSFVFAHIGHA